MLNIPNSPSVAVLIDADNIQLNLLNYALKFANFSGNIEICRAYGDWEKSPLSAWHSAVSELPIDTIQVDRIGKDTSDKKLMIEAVEILCEGQIDVFIIISGDGDFRQLCEYIKSKSRKVIGIGNQGKTSPHLREACNTFYEIEHLEDQLEQIRLEELNTLVFQALLSLTLNQHSYVNLGLLGKQIRELDSRFEARFGDKKLSEWLSNFSDKIEVQGNEVRIINSDFTDRANLLQQAYRCVQRDGLANIGHLGQVLRQLDTQFESRFGKKKLSEWFDTHSHIFVRDGNSVRLASTTL